MKAFETNIDIRANPEAVWSILTDGARWPDWNPTVDKVEGTIGLGSRIRVFAKLSPGRAFPVNVSEFSAPKRMVWSGGMPLGLFKGIRTYSLERTDSGTRYTMREEFSGLLAALFTKSIPDMQPAFDEFGVALKAHAESNAMPDT